MPVPALVVEPVGTVGEDVADPVQSLDIVDQCRASEDADLGNIRRTVAGEAALALDGFDHRRFFTADIGAGPAAQLDLYMIGKPGGANLVQLLTKQGDDFGVFVAHIDEAGLDIDDMRRDQDALDHAMRVRREIQPVLEGAGLALVTIDGHQPRSGLAADDAPFAPGREAGAAEAAQRGVIKRGQHIIGAAAAVQQLAEHGIASIGAIVVKLACCRRYFGMPGLGHARQCFEVGMLDKLVADGCGRRLVTGADTGCGNKPDIVRYIFLKFFKQFLATCHHTGQRCADPDRAGGRRRFTFADEVEMVIEAGNLPDFGHGKAHPVGEGGEMPCRQMVVVVLNDVKAFDQMIAAWRLRAEQFLDFGTSRQIDKAALRLVIAFSTT